MGFLFGYFAEAGTDQVEDSAGAVTGDPRIRLTVVLCLMAMCCAVVWVAIELASASAGLPV